MASVQSTAGSRGVRISGSNAGYTMFRGSVKSTGYLLHLNRPGWRQFSRLLAAEVCTSAVVMLDTPCSEVVWRVLATHSIRQFPLHLPSRASPCAITFQLESNNFSFHGKREKVLLLHTKTALFIPTCNGPLASMNPPPPMKIHRPQQTLYVIMLLNNVLIFLIFTTQQRKCN